MHLPQFSNLSPHTVVHNAETNRQTLIMTIVFTSAFVQVMIKQEKMVFKNTQDKITLSWNYTIENFLSLCLKQFVNITTKITMIIREVNIL